jgi:pimeloyl-ACP methyl ester carboxylesterase
MPPPAMLSFERRGRGEPLVLLHPLGGEWQVWEPVLDVLAAHRDVIALDMPGFGGSAPLPAEVVPTPAELARAIAHAFDALGIEAPHVAGNSLGAWVALELAAARRARSVTVLSPAGLWPRPLAPNGARAHRLARVTLPLLLALVSSAPGRRLVLAKTVSHPERVPAAAARRMVRAYAGATDFERVNAAMRADRFVPAAALDVPVTVAWGALDRVVGRVPLAGATRTVVLRDCGHVPFWDDPPQVARLLLEGSGG